MNKLRVFVIILHFGEEKTTLDCLESLKSSQELNILVVNNTVENEALAVIRKKFPGVGVINTEENLGFAGGNNMGIRDALKEGADFIILLNNDTEVKQDFIKELLRVVQRDKEIGVVSPKIYFAPGFEFHKERYKKEERGKVIWYAGGKIDWQNILGIHQGVDEIDKGQYDQTREIEFATGCCLLVKREVFERVGLFDSRFFLYLEDLDFNVRVKKAGFKIYLAPKAIIWHKNLGTTSKSQMRQAYYYTRNRLLFGFKHAPFGTKLSLLKWSLKKVFKGSFLEKRGVKDFYLGRFGRGSDGDS